ncbi:MAG TPA: GntG family PLP-dependent aldolase [bacterium]|nr:GntG family PLP-dependent aldolase [bacterium]
MEQEIIDLRSDVKTLPTKEMLEAIREAQMGDAKTGEDPTVNRLETMAAEMFGKEAALLLISGTMANLTAMMAHITPGNSYAVDAEAHVYFYENAHSAVAGTKPIIFRSVNGLIEPEEVKKTIEESGKKPGLLWLENTHNRGGGRVIPVGTQRKFFDMAKNRGMKIHVDGARIFNASVASKVPVSEYGKYVDSIMFCLSKSLCCPLGSVLCGDADFIERARGFMGMFGGGMRQAGVIAAPGIVALTTMIERLKEDHMLARKLAEKVREIPGLSVEMETVETNMVAVDFDRSAHCLEDWTEKFKEQGVLVSSYSPSKIRMVTHRHHNAEIIEEAARRIKTAAEKLCG